LIKKGYVWFWPIKKADFNMLIKSNKSLIDVGLIKHYVSFLCLQGCVWLVIWWKKKNTKCIDTTAHIVKMFYIEILCITLQERNVKRFVQNWHLPKSPWTEWSWLKIGTPTVYIVISSILMPQNCISRYFFYIFKIVVAVMFDYLTV
jgi:hypothetical protein